MPILNLLIQYLFIVPVTLISLSIHEFSHGLASYLQGDNTAKYQGRLTINPLKHLDPIGTVCMILFHVGWARPVPINPYYYKNQKVGTVITALAGPLSNFLLSIISLFFLTLTYKYVSYESFLYFILSNLLTITHIYNLYLCIFNLIPIPPFDGSRIFLSFLPSNMYFKVMQYERYIQIGLIVLLAFMSRFNLLSYIATPISNAFFRLFANIINLT